MPNPSNRRRLRLLAAIAVVKALSARVLLVAHMAFSIWAATCVADSAAVWALMSVLGLFLVETVYSIVKRKGQEPQWFSPCIFLYLLAVVPPIWILNLDMIHCLISSRQYGNGSCVGLASSGADCALVSLDSYFSRKPLAYTLEEIMLLLLIVSRWLLPKGNITRDQLSLLLLVYFGIGFDIMELFYLFEELDVLLSRGTTYAILIVWTVSLFQFTIVLTTVKARRPPRLSLQTTPLRRLVACRCCQFEIWGLLTSVFMQDGPFLILRLHCLIGMKLFSYNLLFYTVKNVLVVVLQAYRFAVLVLDCRENFDTTDMERSASMASIASAKQRNGAAAGPRSVDGASTYSQPRNANYVDLTQNQDFSFESAV